MQLKLKENAQVPAVFIKKQLKPTPLKYLISLISVTSYNSQNKIKRQDTTKMTLSYRSSNSSKSNQQKAISHQNQLKVGKSISIVSKIFVHFCHMETTRANKWTLMRLNSLNWLKRSDLKRHMLMQSYHLKNSKREFQFSIWMKH